MYYKVRRVGETLGRSTDHIGARAQCLTRPWKRGPKVRWPFEPHRSEGPMSKICLQSAKECVTKSAGHLGLRAQCLTRHWERGPKVRWAGEPPRTEGPTS